MNILRGFLAGAFLLAAAPLSAADQGIKALAGVWEGSVTVSPGGCVWKVTVNLKEQQGFVSGNFAYSGPCSDRNMMGALSARPAERGCYSANAGIPGMRKLRLSACFDSGNLIFTSASLNGSLKFSPGGRKAVLDAKTRLSGAEGAFKKLARNPGAVAGIKEKKTAPRAEARPLQVQDSPK